MSILTNFSTELKISVTLATAVLILFFMLVFFVPTITGELIYNIPISSREFEYTITLDTGTYLFIFTYSPMSGQYYSFGKLATIEIVNSTKTISKNDFLSRTEGYSKPFKALKAFSLIKVFGKQDLKIRVISYQPLLSPQILIRKNPVVVFEGLYK